MKEITTTTAVCANCGSSFSHPFLGDFSYGECIFCSIDGQSFAIADAFSSFAQRVAALHKRLECKPTTFWPSLASLADPIAGQLLTISVRCPHCCSKNLASWGGKVTGHTPVPDASYTIASALSDAALGERVMAISGQTFTA
jgi:hypothetical protein